MMHGEDKPLILGEYNAAQKDGGDAPRLGAGYVFRRGLVADEAGLVPTTESF